MTLMGFDIINLNLSQISVLNNSQVFIINLRGQGGGKSEYIFY